MCRVCFHEDAFASRPQCEPGCSSSINKRGGNLKSLIFVPHVHPQKEMCFLLIIEDVTKNSEHIYLFLVHLPRLTFPLRALVERPEQFTSLTSPAKLQMKSSPSSLDTHTHTHTYNSLEKQGRPLSEMFRNS